MSNYFFTSDTHFYHDNIRKHCNRPLANVREMNETIIEDWNAVVKPNDHVYHLGDFSLTSSDNRLETFNRMNGRKYLCPGNHDSNSIKELKWVWVKQAALIKIHDQYVWLSHYPHRVWDRMQYGSWHLFGHVHSFLFPYAASFSVGQDAWDSRPVHWDEILEKMPEVIAASERMPDFIAEKNRQRSVDEK